MKKVFFVLLTILLFAGNAFALNLVVTCPASVTVGNPVNLTVKVYNYDCASSVSFSRVMKGLVGNAGGTMGGAGIWGPYAASVGTKNLAAANCSTPPPIPTQVTLWPSIISAAPASLANTMAMAYVEIISATGESLGGGSCMVEIKP